MADYDDDEDGDVDDMAGPSVMASTAAAYGCAEAGFAPTATRPEPATLSWGTCSSARRSGRTRRTDRTGCPCASTVR